MTFKLSKRSEDRLLGVDERLVTVVKAAIHTTKVDFGVICGMRTSKEQEELVANQVGCSMDCAKYCLL